MKTLLKRITLCVLSGIMLFSCFGCKGKDTIPTETSNPNHVFSYTETQSYLVENGKTEYKLVVPETLSTEILLAKDEMLRFFHEATGITLSVVTDAGKSHSDSEKYISIGDTTLYKTSGLNVDKKALNRDGVRILTKGNTIYIVGGSDAGVLYGVYDFLNIHFNFEFYYKDCYTLTTGVKDIKLMDYNVTDIPDIRYRQRRGFLYSSSSDSNDIMFGHRMRTMDGYGDLLLPIHSGDTKETEAKFDHNSFFYLPPERYMEKNPEFYSLNGGQLCYTARGNVQSFDKMTSLCAEKIEQSLRWYPTAEYPNYVGVQLGIMDMVAMCKCDACIKVASEHNDATSATTIIFMNEVGRKVNEWMKLEENKAYAREDFQYMFFVYADNSRPPCDITEDGELIVKDDLIPAEGVKVVPFCAQSGFDYGKDFYSVQNQEMRGYAETWAKLYKDCWAWSYGAFFLDYLAFYDCYNFYGDYFAFLKKNNYQFSFVQVHDSQRGSDTGFFALASYLCCKLSWDSSLDMQELINNYFQAMYKEAAEPMRKLFNELRIWFTKTSTENGWTSSSIQYNITGSKRYTNIGFVRGIFERLEEAYDAIEIYRKDEATYNSLRGHIDMEWLFPGKMAISNYETEYTSAQFTAIKKKFKTLCEELGIIHIQEFTSITPFLEAL